MSKVALQNVKKSFGSLEVISDVDLEIDDGEFVVFVGPSGSGKSTMLRILAGLEDVTSGQVWIGGRDVTYTAPADRGVAMVFQSYALYPHMSVFENIAFNLRLNRTPKREIKERVHDAAHILKLTELLNRRPSQLSGGQRQRVAIGRAIVRDPDVFLFDEPLSNLDAALRVDTRLEIEKLHRELRSTMVYVTHDQTEAMTLADRIVAFDDGKIQQIGSPLELYHNPSNLFVAGFIGSPRMNFLPAKADASGIAIVELHALQKVDLGRHTLTCGAALTLGIRPEALRLEPAGTKRSQDVVVEGEILAHEQLGNVSYAHIISGDIPPLVAQLSADSEFAKGDRVSVIMPTQEFHVFDAQGLSISE